MGDGLLLGQLSGAACSVLLGNLAPRRFSLWEGDLGRIVVRLLDYYTRLYLPEKRDTKRISRRAVPRVFLPCDGYLQRLHVSFGFLLEIVVSFIGSGLACSEAW